MCGILKIVLVDFVVGCCCVVMVCFRILLLSYFSFVSIYWIIFYAVILYISSLPPYNTYYTDISSMILLYYLLVDR